MDGETILHDDASAEEADTGDHLRENTEVVIVDRSASQPGIHDDALAYQYKYARAGGDERIGSEAGLTLLEFALGADDDTCEEGAGEAEDECF